MDVLIVTGTSVYSVIVCLSAVQFESPTKWSLADRKTDNGTSQFQGSPMTMSAVAGLHQ